MNRLKCLSCIMVLGALCQSVIPKDIFDKNFRLEYDSLLGFRGEYLFDNNYSIYLHPLIAYNARVKFVDDYYMTKEFGAEVGMGKYFSLYTYKDLHINFKIFGSAGYEVFYLEELSSVPVVQIYPWDTNSESEYNTIVNNVIFNLGIQPEVSLNNRIALSLYPTFLNLEINDFDRDKVTYDLDKKYQRYNFREFLFGIKVNLF